MAKKEDFKVVKEQTAQMPLFISIQMFVKKFIAIDKGMLYNYKKHLGYDRAS